jgi:hypothetical protein
MGLLDGCDGVERRLDLVDGVLLVAADLEVDERRVPAACDSPAAHVLHRSHIGDVRDHVAHNGREGGVAPAGAAALDQDALARRPVEALVEDLLHPAGLAGAGGAV